jgi:hypothetical protein
MCRRSVVIQPSSLIVRSALATPEREECGSASEVLLGDRKPDPDPRLACPLKPWVRFVGYNGYPNHGDPAHTGPIAHIHVSWQASGHGAAALSAPNDWVRVFPFPAPGDTASPRGGEG